MSNRYRKRQWSRSHPAKKTPRRSVKLKVSFWMPTKHCRKIDANGLRQRANQSRTERIEGWRKFLPKKSFGYILFLADAPAWGRVSSVVLMRHTHFTSDKKWRPRRHSPNKPRMQKLRAGRISGQGAGWRWRGHGQWSGGPHDLRSPLPKPGVKCPACAVDKGVDRR